MRTKDMSNIELAKLIMDWTLLIMYATFSMISSLVVSVIFVTTKNYLVLSFFLPIAYSAYNMLRLGDELILRLRK